MKKYLIGGVLVVAFVIYAIFANENSMPSEVMAPSATPTTTGPGGTATTPPIATSTAAGTPPGGTTTDTFTGDLSFGARGSQVSLLQQFLMSNSYLTVPAATGYFGPLTQAALAKYQTANGIIPATGALDAQTRDLIGAASIAMSTTTPTPTPTPASGQYKDGTYTGAVADAFYGKLQATVTIQGGAITNVTFPQAPSGGHSSQVSATALPKLAQEAITAQSANVNVVSGATQDSNAFQQTMASALAQAKA